MLQKHADKMLEEAKDSLLKLVSVENPSEIDETIGDFVVYGEALDDTRDTVNDRRTELVRLAKQSLQVSHGLQLQSMWTIPTAAVS